MPSVTLRLPWPTLSVAPLPPTLVLTPVLLRLILTPGRMLIVLRKRKYPMGLTPLVDCSGHPSQGDRHSGRVHQPRHSTTASACGRRAHLQRFRLNRFPNLLSLSLTCPTVEFLAFRRSCADSRSSVSAYFFCMPASASSSACRSCGVSGPTRDIGGRTSVRCTTDGSPLLCSTDTSASPTCSSCNTRSVLRSGFLRKVWAAARTAFCSLGVKARRACWMRLPSCAEMRSGTSPGLCVT